MIEVRPLQESDIPAVVDLQRACFPPPFSEDLLWKPEHLRRHLSVFPDGQLVAAEAENLVASCTNLIISEANWQAHRNWEETVGGHFLNEHDARGTTLYGVDISVHPNARMRGVARRLYEARFRLVAERGLQRYGTAVRMPNFSTSGEPSVHVYVRKVAAGELTDRTLTPLLKLGCRATGVIENHMEDEESGHAAAILEWTP
jgi:ribosomal protein S18 acetylase RimI-like enzyme